MLTVGSLFSGIGGFDLAFERAGFEVRWQVEIDLFCLGVLAKHWPNVRRYDDVRTVGADLEPVDWIVGGFPCQDLSSAGKRAGVNGSRSGLWREFVRVVDARQPRGVLIENVHHAWRGWVPVLRRALWGIGYPSLPIRLRASDFGAWHERSRVFLVAHVDPSVLRLESWRQCWPFWPEDPPLFADAGQTRRPSWANPLEDGTVRGVQCAAPPTNSGGSGLDAEACRIGRFVANAGGGGCGAARAARPEVGGERSATPDADAVRELQPEGRERDEWRRSVHGAGWATEPDVVRVVHGVSSRLDRRRAAARIAALGNAVIPEEVEWIARRLIEAEVLIQESAE